MEDSGEAGEPHLVLGIATCLLVLAEALPSTGRLRVVLIGVAAMALLTLLVRISAKVIQATAS